MTRFAAIALIALSLLACDTTANNPAATAADDAHSATAASAASDGGEVVATVAGTDITRSELEATVRAQLIELDNQRYQLLRGGLDQLIGQQLLQKEAEARGVSLGELMNAEVTSKLSEPTEEEINQVYEANKAQLGDATLEDLKPRIVEFLSQQQSAQLHGQLIASLRDKYETVVNLPIPRVQVSDGGRESRGGGEDAPVTIIAFSDYECPYCRMAEGTVEQVREKYGNKLRYVHRDYPLPFHAHAHVAAQAARCAGEQGKFWEYHEALWKAESLERENLEALATELGLDETEFENCLSSGKEAPGIDADLEAGAQAGVNGTPAFFVNGIMLSGAQPLEAFTAVIDEELARAKN
jgi:protein-disulfide isomerase